MQTTLVVRSSNRAIDPQAQSCVSALVKAGVGLVDQSGTSDVAFARNLALTTAVSVLRTSDRRFDTVVMVDDDMVFSVDAVAELVQASRARSHACSACYALIDGRIPGERLPSGLFMTGLGLLAIPAASLLRLADESLVFTDNAGREIVEFTRSGSEDCSGGRRWMPEDFRLTRALGGVELLPIAVGHLKTKIVLPEREKALALINPTGTP